MRRYVWSLTDGDEAKDQESLLALLLAKRGIDTEASISILRFDLPGIQKAAKRIQRAIERDEQITIYSDYDADGICGVALLWQTLRGIGAKVLPYIPHREKEGYGLKKEAVDRLIGDGTQLIITVDCGITSIEAVEHAREKSVDVIITDHHVAPPELPDAFAIVHDTNVCGAAVAWKLAQVLTKHRYPQKYLDLVATATIADLVPLTRENRILARLGLSVLNATSSFGLQELIAASGLSVGQLSTYEVGHLLVPRINALGRLDHALDALRLLCTTNGARARQLAQVLCTANARRQQLTTEGVQHALEQIKRVNVDTDRVIVMASPSWQQGIIGLIAGRLVEQHYRPAVVISQGAAISKGSARSVAGFNIVEALRSAKDLLVDVGGHPMAAGFTIETGNIPALRECLMSIAQEKLAPELLTRTLLIDALIPVGLVGRELYERMRVLEPFGIGNPEPVFMSSGLQVERVRAVGNGNKHLKLTVSAPSDRVSVDAIGFGHGELASILAPGDLLDIAYSVLQDVWNGNTRVQLKIRDVRRVSVANESA